MSVRIGINGMGRIGRDVLRLTLDDPDLEVVAVNDLIDSAALARLLRRDSTYGRLGRDVVDLADAIEIDDRTIAVTAAHDPGSLPWREHGVQIAIESTGRFRDRASAARHLDAGAERVLLSAPGRGVDVTVVLGVNDDAYDPARHRVISNASCTTNCAAPMAKVLHDAFGIERGHLTTVHAYTNDQNLLDGPHKDPRRARAAAVNIIPTSTGAARAVAEVIPDLAGRLDGLALRVPVVDGSLVELTAVLAGEESADDVVAAYAAAAAEGPLAGRLVVSDEPLVSSDVIGDTASCLFDPDLTVVNGRMVTVFGWYDNERGYTARLLDLARLVAGVA